MGILVEYHTRVDSSDRISLPQQCRQWYKEGVILRYYPDEGCISGWPVSEGVDASADRAAAEIESLLGRKLTGTTHHTMDDPNKIFLGSRGRLTIPRALREQASITNGVIVTCIERYFEVWSEEAWQSYLKSLENNPWLAQGLTEAGLL